MKRYESYKDSGVKWLGEIPGHWEVKRLGSFFIERRVKVSDKDFAPLSVTKNGIFPQLENVAKSNDGDNRKLVRANDFVINSRSDRKGSSGVSSFDGSVSLINIVLKPRNTVYPTFCNYLLKSIAFIEEYYRNGRGIVADLWTTRFDEMKIIKLAMPPKAEQTAIANYLDSVTSKIDEAISQQQKMIDLLNERKQIIIQNAVTKGLDPNAKMKDSGVEWIGEIPENWEVYKFGRLISLLTDYTANGSFGDLAKNIHYQNEGYARLVRLTDLRENLNNIGVWVDKHGYDFLSKSWLKGGELLIANVGAYSGLPCIMPKVPYPTTLAPNMFLLKLNESKIYTKYIYYLLLSNCYFNWLQTIATSSAQPKLNKDNIRQLIIIHPINIKDQYDIVLYIKKKIHSIDELISQCNKMIFLLQERKQIIINDVVTGKVKVI